MSKKTRHSGSRRRSNASSLAVRHSSEGRGVNTQQHHPVFSDGSGCRIKCGITKRGNAPGRASLWSQKILIAGLLLGVISLLYGNSLRDDFTNWDDPMIIVGNPVIRNVDWQNITRIFTPQKASTYQPIRVLSYAIDYHLWKLNPTGYHLTNTLFYFLTCLVVFFVARFLLNRMLSLTPPASDRVAFFTAFLFAVHPVHVEAVTWLSARKEVLHGFFFFLSFYVYMKTVEIQEMRKRWIYAAMALLTFLLAVLSKPSAVVLPALIALYEVTRKGGQLRQFVREHFRFVGPFLVVSGVMALAFSFILLKAISQAGGLRPFYGGSLGSNLVIVAYLILYNIKLVAFTIAYSAAYTVTAAFSPLSKWTIGVFATLLLLFVVVLWSRKKTPIFFFSFFWFLLALLPFLNLIPIGILLADRYTYLSSFGYCLAVGFVLNYFYGPEDGKGSSFLRKAIAVCLFVVLLGGYSKITVEQNRIWKDSFTLWSDAVRKYPLSNLGNSMMGLVFMQRGENEEAAKYFERAIRVRPTDAIARTNLGIVYTRLNEPDRALSEFLEAVRLEPDRELPKLRLASFYFLTKEYQKSEEILEGLLKTDPGNAEVHLLLGELYKTTGREALAFSEIAEARRLSQGKNTGGGNQKDQSARPNALLPNLSR